MILVYLLCLAVPLLLFACKKKKTVKDSTTGPKDSNKAKPSKEVLEWNAKINAGMKRPQKDDETVDDMPTDWGQVQKVGDIVEPEGGTKSLKPDSGIDSKVATGTK
ncbi:hypothetical protein PFISCL1PPCAC_19184, partial [Pristionchus fissidentatus]